MRLKITTRIVLLLYAALALGACASDPVHRTTKHSYQVQGNALHIARSMVGVPYRYGGRHPETGFDCSGLVYYAHQQAGLELPRTSIGQFRASQPVSRTALRPGDLVFFRIRRNRISHVGIYMGKGRFVHAPSSGKEVSIGSMKDPYWQKHFVRGGRVF